MKISKQAKREARQLFRFCLVNGLLDESRVRHVVQRVDRGRAPGLSGHPRAFSAVGEDSTSPGTRPPSRAPRRCRRICRLPSKPV